MMSKKYSQSPHHIPRNQCLNRANHRENHGYHPDELPIAILHGTGIGRGYEMRTSDKDEGPVEGETPDGLRVVEIDVLRPVDGKGPVEGGEGRVFVGEGAGVDLESEEVVAREGRKELVGGKSGMRMLRVMYLILDENSTDESLFCGLGCAWGMVPVIVDDNVVYCQGKVAFLIVKPGDCRQIT